MKVGDLVRALGGFRKGEIGIVAKIDPPVPPGTSGPVQQAHVLVMTYLMLCGVTEVWANLFGTMIWW